jgi:hypothetical protein
MLTQVLQEGVNELASERGLIRRQSKITGQSLVQGLVFGFMEQPQASEVQLAQSVSRAGIAVTPQAVNARLTQEAAEVFQGVLERMVHIALHRQPPGCASTRTQTLLDRFSEVNVHDSTVISLPNTLYAVWPGCGSRTGQGQAALKLQVQWDVRSGALKLLTLHAGREQDRAAPAQTAEVSAGSLRLADLGYFDLSAFERIGQAQAFWLTRYLSGVCVFRPDGTRVHLPDELEQCCTQDVNVDVPVLVGSACRLPARLVAIRVPQAVADERRRKLRDTARRKGQAASACSLALAAWSIFLTNVPAELLTLDEILLVARVRWQIELLFKLWKSVGHLDTSRSRKPYRILCELYAKLIGQIVQHSLMIYSCWAHPDRSLVKAAAAVASCATALLLALHTLASDRVSAIAAVIDALARSVATTCRISPRTTRLATFQLLAIDLP